MALSVAAMGLAPAFWMVLALAVLSGVGNSVIHPADYAILAGSIDKGFMGRAFALHTFTGNLGFALAPPAIALMLALHGLARGAAAGGPARRAGGGRDPAPEPGLAGPAEAPRQEEGPPAGRCCSAGPCCSSSPSSCCPPWPGRACRLGW
jgi:MFS family permease